jgi:hypothetical protein
VPREAELPLLGEEELVLHDEDLGARGHPLPGGLRGDPELRMRRGEPRDEAVAEDQCVLRQRIGSCTSLRQTDRDNGGCGWSDRGNRRARGRHRGHPRRCGRGTTVGTRGDAARHGSRRVLSSAAGAG